MRGCGIYFTYLFILGSSFFVEIFVFSLIYFVYGFSLKTIVGVLGFGLVVLLITKYIIGLLGKLIDEKNKGRLIEKYAKSKILNKKYKTMKTLMFVVGIIFYIMGFVASLNMNLYAKLLLFSISAFFILTSVSMCDVMVEFYEGGVFINPLGFYKWEEIKKEEIRNKIILKIKNFVIECEKNI